MRIAHGKDRCANPPRSGPQGGAGGAKRSSSGNGVVIDGLSANGMGNGDAHNGHPLLEDDLVDEEHVGEMHIDSSNGIIVSQAA